MIASWRTALRVAQREARRAKGRSSLVVAMIGLPVLCLVFAAVTYDMFTLNGEEKADQTMGTADARVQWPWRSATEQGVDPATSNFWPSANAVDQGERKPPTQAELAAKLPAGSRLVPVRRGAVVLRTTDGIAQPNMVSVDATDPLTRRFVEVLDGRAPSAPTEVALTEQAMERLGVGVGGTVTSGDGLRSYRVVGQVEFPSLLEEVVLFAPITEEAPTGFAFRDQSWLVDTPSPVDWAQVRTLNRDGIVVASRAVFIDPPPDDQVPLQWSPELVPEELAIGVLIAGLALLEIVLLAGPAFAVSARRRQRQLALVAANGGTPAHVRRIVLADGVVLGFVGAVVGIVAGIAAAFVGRPYVEELLSHSRAGGYRVFPLALLVIAGLAVVTGVLAALVPAFITARQNVIASLAGRRGATRSRKRWIVLGVAMAALGSGVTLYGTYESSASIILAGLVLGELGLVLCTPALVGLIARIGRILPVAPRIALRDAARNRAAAAPAISAVMAAVAGSVAIGLYLESDQVRAERSYSASMPTGYVEIYQNQSDPKAPNAADRSDVDAALRSTLPVGEIRETGRPVCPASSAADDYCDLQVVVPPERDCPYLAIMQTRMLTTDEMRAARQDSRCADEWVNGRRTGGTIVDDGSALAVMTAAQEDDLAAAVAMLRSGGVVVRDPRQIKDGRATFAVIKQSTKDNSGDPVAAAPKMTFPAYLLTSGVTGTPILSPGALAQTGLASTPNRLVVSTTREPTQAEEDRIVRQLQAMGLYPYIERGPTWFVDARLWILMAAAALITIGAAGIGTGLAAADGRADLSTLAAVGASPRLRRGLSLSQSGVIAGLGSILGTLAGVGAAVAVIISLNQRYVNVWPAPSDTPITVPWISLAMALVVAPLIAIFGAGMLTRSRLPIERRL